VKNTLATVQAIADLGLSQGGDPGTFAEAFRNRLMALARAHDLLTQTAWEGADLGDIAEQVLKPFGAGSRRLALDGPAVRLAPNTAVTLSMGLHELATNAAKYGALSAPEGNVRLSWTVETDADGTAAAVVILWHEEGGPVVSTPAQKGFGSRLIEQGLAHELAAAIRLDYAASGVECRIRLPLPHRPTETADPTGSEAS
jgi:two-component sensor histidine kinase